MVREHKAGREDAAGRQSGNAAAMTSSQGRPLWSGLFAGLMFLMLATLLGACAATYRNHGYVPPETELSLLEVGADTRETVAEKVGRPTALGLLNDVGWYYVQSRYKQYGPREPQEIDRQVVAITFDEGGVVRNIERFGLEGGKVVILSRRITETSIQEVSLISQLLRNAGRILPSSFVN
jgi:outer membrane protein assembly factor BamE (lipoprotein component of BamABCDE complex)